MSPVRKVTLVIVLVLGVWGGWRYFNPPLPVHAVAGQEVLVGGSDTATRAKAPVKGEAFFAKRKDFSYIWEEDDQSVDVFFKPDSVLIVMRDHGIGSTLVEQVRILCARNGEVVDPVLKHESKLDSLSFQVKKFGADAKYLIEDIAYLLDSDPDDRFSAISQEDLKPVGR